MLSVVVLLVLGTAGILFSQRTAPPEPMVSVSGELAFSKTIVFDYDRDGSQDRVQFWISFEAQPPASTPGRTDAKLAGGYLSYYVYDVERHKRIDDWMLGFNMTMGGGFPRAGEKYPLTNVRITGLQAQFDLGSTSFRIIDGGNSWKKDTIEVTDVNGTRIARFYGGDVRIIPNQLEVAKPLDIKANRECIECHETSAVSIAVKGGPHHDFKCTDCHTEHPPDVEGVTFPNCLGCHDSHSEAMSASSCAECHGNHDVTRYIHTVTMPDTYCGACHDDVIETLKSSRSLHMGVACVLCHQNEHSAKAKECQYCHRGTHPEHVMRNPDRCGDCHNSAHDLKSARNG
jgi:hypothetical protein